MTDMTVCTIQVQPDELHEGSIVAAGGRARYMRKQLPPFLGYVRWEYTTHRPDGSITGQGVAEFRRDVPVTVVAVTLDGAMVTT